MRDSVWQQIIGSLFSSRFELEIGFYLPHWKLLQKKKKKKKNNPSSIQYTATCISIGMPGARN